MDKKEMVRIIAKARVALDRVKAQTEEECLSKCVAYKAMAELERMAMAEEVDVVGDGDRAGRMD
jgi:hypothetical protein